MSTENPYQEITIGSSKFKQPLYMEIVNQPLNHSKVVENVAISDLHIEGHLRSGSFATICQGTFCGRACIVKRPGKCCGFVHLSIIIFEYARDL